MAVTVSRPTSGLRLCRTITAPGSDGQRPDDQRRAATQSGSGQHRQEHDRVPNPAADLLQIDFESVNESENFLISLIDLSGRQVIRQQVNSITGLNRIGLNVADLPRGVYFAYLAGDRTYRLCEGGSSVIGHFGNVNSLPDPAGCFFSTITDFPERTILASFLVVRLREWKFRIQDLPDQRSETFFEFVQLFGGNVSPVVKVPYAFPHFAQVNNAVLTVSYAPPCNTIQA